MNLFQHLTYQACNYNTVYQTKLDQNISNKNFCGFRSNLKCSIFPTAISVDINRINTCIAEHFENQNH